MVDKKSRKTKFFNSNELTTWDVLRLLYSLYSISQLDTYLTQ